MGLVICIASTSLSYPSFETTEVVSAHVGKARAAVLDVIFLGWPSQVSMPFLIIAIPHSIRVRIYEGLASKGDSP